MYIDPKLREDCVVLGTLDRAGLLLHRNASVGWLILVPDTDALDWQQLDDAEHDRVVNQLRAVSVFASEWFTADKMNVASLGNVVSQLHIHIIARHVGDACWPQPVWGHLDVWRNYSPEAIESLRTALVRDQALSPLASN